MVLEFNQLADPDEKEILKTNAVKVENTDKYMHLFVDLQDTAKANDAVCIGIASNQIWKLQEEPPPAVFIIKLDKLVGWKLFVNPVIKGTGPKVSLREGCMSLKGKKPKMKKRDKNVIITYWDPATQLEATEKYFGYDARTIQHEMDHLNGILI